MKPRSLSHEADVGFQIAPMIDVVFVILVFFMALAAQIRIEHSLQTTLPGVAVAGSPAPLVDEQLIQIDASGEVRLNDEALDATESVHLPQLRATMLRLKESADAAKSTVVVTVIGHPDSAYGRTIEVLNVLAAAGIRQVTFTTEEES
jgi:biopolymer transport protein ExbD